MIWAVSILIGILAGALGALAAGFVAARAVDWYHIPSREGASGYFVVFIGLIGIAVGFIIGIACGLVVRPDTGPGFFKALGLALATVAFLSASSGVVTRLHADVPPTLRGERLFLIVEAKYPPTRIAPPTLEPGEAYVRLGSLKGHTLRKSERGQLWKHEAMLVDGQWIVRGAADIFTSRGRRIIEINLGTPPSVGFIIPLPAYPRHADESWSNWMPRRFAPSTPIADQVTYRFRIQRPSEPMHTETFGNFEIVTFTYCFHESWEHGQARVVSNDSFAIAYHGTPVNFDNARIDPPPVRNLIKLQNNTKALLVIVANAEGEHTLYLIKEVDNALHMKTVVQSTGSCVTLNPLSPAAAPKEPQLSENCHQLVADGLYRVGLNTIFDTRTFQTHRYDASPNTELGDFRPLGLAPDERSFVRFTFAPDTQAHMLTVTDFVRNRSYSLPIDRDRMRYVKIEHVDRTWTDHHFRWERDATGADELVARTEFTLLPYRGELGASGDSGSAYYLYGSDESIGRVLENVLVEKFAAEKLPPVEYQVDQRFRVDGNTVSVFASPSIASVSTSDAKLMNRVADALNAELATYKHDALFSFKN